MIIFRAIYAFTPFLLPIMMQPHHVFLPCRHQLWAMIRPKPRIVGSREDNKGLCSDDDDEGEYTGGGARSGSEWRRKSSKSREVGVGCSDTLKVEEEEEEGEGSTDIVRLISLLHDDRHHTPQVLHPSSAWSLDNTARSP